MKIFLLPSWYPSKERPLDGVFFKEQAEALVKKNIEVVVVNVVIKSLSEYSRDTNKGTLQFFEENGVKVYKFITYNYFPRLTELYLRYYARILKKVFNKVVEIEGEPDLVHIHSAIDIGIAYTLSKIKVPYVITEHSTKYSRNILNNTQKKYLESVFTKAKKVMTVGVGLKSEISKYISASKIDVVYNPVIMPVVMPKVDDNKKKFRFFSLGLLSSKKGMDALIEAYDKYKGQLSNTELYIGGHGEEFSNLEKLIKEHGLENRIFLLGSLDRAAVAFNMKNCDCFVLASRFETFGIVFVEAMYYGKPVIATRTGGPDSFLNDECGILVDVDDIDGIGKAMVEVRNNYHSYDSNKIIDFCKDNFSEEVIIEKLKHIYNEVIGEENDKRNDF